jgi:hypothetical protein
MRILWVQPGGSHGAETAADLDYARPGAMRSRAAGSPRAQAKERVEPLLPVHCVIGEAILHEEYELDRMLVRETFRFGG